MRNGNSTFDVLLFLYNETMTNTSINFNSNSTNDSSRYQLEFSINYAIGLALLCFIGGIENILILLTLIGSKRLRSAYYAFISNLASAQLIFCIVIGIAFGWLRIIFFLNNISPVTTMMACSAGMLPYHAAQVSALLTRFTIGMDRLLAFSCPMEYRNRSKYYSILMIIVCWAWPLIEVLIYFGINYETFKNRPMPMCSGSGWKIGVFLTYTAYRDLIMAGLTVLTYLITAGLVTRKFTRTWLSSNRREWKLQFHNKPYQFRLLIASGMDAMIFTGCSFMAYIIRTFILMQLNGHDRLSANFSVGLLLAATNVTDFILYLMINRDFRTEFIGLFSMKTIRIRALSLSSNSGTTILRRGSNESSIVDRVKNFLCINCGRG